MKSISNITITSLFDRHYLLTTEANVDINKFVTGVPQNYNHRFTIVGTVTSDSMYPVGGVPSNLPPQYAFNNPGGATSTSPHRMADQFQTLVNATINTSTVDASQLEFASLNSADLLPIDGSTASFITDTMQPSGDSTYSDMFGNISIPSFPETELQADVAQMFPEPSVGAHEVYPPK